MSRAGGRIPLHGNVPLFDFICFSDHQGNYGFIRVLRGRLRIRSFSWLDEDVERRLANNNEQGLRPTVYEGEQILTPHDSVAMLSPLKGNVHEVIADSDNTAFFDLLIPGYSDELPCLFYRLSDKSKDTQTGDVCWLKQIPMPQDYCTDHLPYPCISYLT
jgi:hypothetical protein